MRHLAVGCPVHGGSLTLSGQGLFSGRRFQKGSRLECGQFREVAASDSVSELARARTGR